MEQIESRMRPRTARASRPSLFSLAGVAFLTVLTIAAGATFASIGNASANHFSQTQINSYVKTVASEIELTNNRNINFGPSTGTSLSCYPTVYGQGVLGGHEGLYVWVTCNAMRKLDVRFLRSSSTACSGFSVPLWIEVSSKNVSYRAISTGSEYLAFRLSAPGDVQKALDATYEQMHKPGRTISLKNHATRRTVANLDSLTACK